MRFRDEVPPVLGANLWVAARTLMGLRYRREEIDELIRGVRAMIMGIRGIEASSFYQDILAEGRVEGRLEAVRRVIFQLGRVRFGEPTTTQVIAVETMTDLHRAEARVERILFAESWSDLLANP